MITDKEQIVAACQRKDPKALKRLYEELAPAMLGVCMRYTHSRDEAQDLLHDGFIKVFESIGELKNPLTVEAWIRQIMVNLSIDYVTRNTNLRYYDDEKIEDMNKSLADEELEMDTKAAMVEDVVEALQSLPSRYRAAFNMRAVEEMDYGEISALFHKPESTVRSYVARARQMILEKLKEMKGIKDE